MISLMQHFEDDFLWKVILKILNSGIILKTFTHEYVPRSHVMAHKLSYPTEITIRIESHQRIPHATDHE